MVTLHNLAEEEVEVRLRAKRLAAELTPLFSDDGDREPRNTLHPINLRPYGFRWFRAGGERR